MFSVFRTFVTLVLPGRRAHPPFFVSLLDGSVYLILKRLIIFYEKKEGEREIDTYENPKSREDL